MIAVIAGVIFAGFLALTPRLAAGPQTTEAAGPAPVVTTVPRLAQDLPTNPVEAVPDIGLRDGSDQDQVEDEAGESVTTTTTTTTIVAGPEPDGTLTMTVELVGPRDADEIVILEDEDVVNWHFRVVNSGGEKLWGVYVYLEGHGRVWCDHSSLLAGHATDCWARDSVWAGANTADAWATAWTTQRQVAARISYAYFVNE